ncbi:two-component regulator propeller domain-containing protein, partial [Aquiflexum sp.]|uniref:ligand-binding sensor domain-containing protein n=1 Tax=Aquiflexum sp. TaxID=1872584 RepID=UPI003592EB46
MKTFNLLLAICVGFLFSCNSKQEFKSPEKSIEKESLVPLQRTVIADLPDSLQPKTYFLKDMPKPMVRAVPKRGGETIMLPVLENEKGEPILDEEGNTILLGDGGLSDFTTFTTGDGLALDVVLCSIMDKSGNLWFGTQRGVSRYDGKSFTNFTTSHGLTSNYVFNMIEDKSGNIWIGTSDGVSLFDGKSFTIITTAQDLKNNYVLTIMEDKNEDFWFGTYGNGVTKFDGQNFTSFTTKDGLASNVVGSILEDKSGNLWFGTNGGGVSRYDGESFTTFTMAQGLPNNFIWNIFEDRTGKLWFGTSGGGLSQYDGNSFTTFLAELGQAKINSISSIFEDNEGSLWYGSWEKGVSCYDGKFLKNFTNTQGLANSTVLSITDDKTGSIWFSTNGGGVSRYNGKAFINFSKAHGLPGSKVNSINEDKTGNLWFSTEGGGVSCFDGKSFTTFSKAHGFSDFQVYCTIEDKKGNLWFGTVNGVFNLSGKFFTHFTTAQGLTSNFVQCITEDSEGNLWFGTVDNGVSKFDGKSITNYSSDHGLGNNDVNVILQDSFGKIWFGTNGGGASRYDGKSFENFTTGHGLSNNFVNTIYEDVSGNLWFGTDKGLSFLTLKSYNQLVQGESQNGDFESDQNPDNHTYQIQSESKIKIAKQNSVSPTFFKSFGIAEGLPDEAVTQILQMVNGKMAIGTNLGLTVFNISEDYTSLTDLEIFNSSTGNPVKDVNFGQDAMLLDSKGIIWAGTGSDKTALVRFDYEALYRSVVLPVVVIQSIKVKDENISWHTIKESVNNVDTRKSNQKFEMVNSQEGITIPAYITEEVSLFGRELGLAERDSMKQRFGKIEFDGVRPFYPLPENLVLPYNLNQVSFEFVAIETSRPQMVKYQYLLEGYDEDWRPVTNRSNATFGNIHEGTYTFKLKAQGANGIWTEPMTYTFRVLPPWYRTWWAYGIYLLFFAGLVWRIHLIQKARTIRLERE